MLLALLMSASALGPHSGTYYHDVPLPPEGGEQYVLRTSPMSDFAEGLADVEQRMRVLPNGEYEIDASKQSEATKLYHQAYCLEMGRVPLMGRGVIGGDAAVGGWSCMTDDSDVGESVPWNRARSTL